jgi:hypothetical protein
MQRMTSSYQRACSVPQSCFTNPKNVLGAIASDLDDYLSKRQPRGKFLELSGSGRNALNRKNVLGPIRCDSSPPNTTTNPKNVLRANDVVARYRTPSGTRKMFLDLRARLEVLADRKMLLELSPSWRPAIAITPSAITKWIGAAAQSSRMLRWIPFQWKNVLRPAMLGPSTMPNVFFVLSVTPGPLMRFDLGQRIRRTWTQPRSEAATDDRAQLVRPRGHLISSPQF